MLAWRARILRFQAESVASNLRVQFGDGSRNEWFGAIADD
jgi:hypothetical protein